jgi:Domain of unknown function (DUF222)/HNH endonuclease
MCSQVIDAGSDGTATRPLEVLEREITSLASQIHAATCRWLELVAEYDMREGWAQWGCRSCAHWVSWQCGIAPGPAREHVRVARRLNELPLIRAAFAEGELSFSKVRALTRVENVEREADLLDLARHATASQLERLLRAYPGVVAAERAAGGGRPERWLAIDHDDDGSVLLRGRFPAEEGALIVAALQAAQDEPVAWAGESASDDETDVPAGTPGDEADVSAGTRGDEADVPAGTLRMSPAEARAEALVAVADSFLAGENRSRSGGDRHLVLVHVEAGTLSGAGEAGRCELDSGAPLTPETARRLACDASIVRVLERDGTPVRMGRKTRSIPPALRRALHARDRVCRFPGCGSRRFVDAHHIDHWAHGGPTDLDNLVQLCGAHHRLLHEGGYRIERRSGGGLCFRRPDGRTISECPAAPRGTSGRLERTRRPDACVPLSHDHMDLELAVDAMLTFAPFASDEPPGV